MKQEFPNVQIRNVIGPMGTKVTARNFPLDFTKEEVISLYARGAQDAAKCVELKETINEGLSLIYFNSLL